MNYFDKNIDQIDEEDLQFLIEDQTPESRTLEYKSELNLQKDNNKIEFAKDISSFANSAGGLIIYGMAEGKNEGNKGKPETLCGFNPDPIDEDEFKRKVYQILQTNISPKIPSLNTHFVPLKNGKKAFLVDVPKSFVAPHIVKKEHRFYHRDDAMRHHMDEQELKTAFIASENVTEKIKRFREKRIMDILANEGPVNVTSEGALFYHIIPLNALESNQYIDLHNLRKKPKIEEILYNWSTRKRRYNLDGFCAYRETKIAKQYFQFFNSGIIEYFDARLLKPTFKKENTICSDVIECRISITILDFLELQDLFEIYYPRIVMVNLVKVKDYKLTIDKNFNSLSAFSIDRDIVQLPEIIIEEHPQNTPNEAKSGIFELSKMLKPVFDAIWQSAGESKSGYYDSEDTWIFWK